MPLTIRLRGGGLRKKLATSNVGDDKLLQSMRTSPSSPLARTALGEPDTEVQPREVVYNCLYTDRPGHSRAHQRWKDGILIVTDGKTCGLMTEDRDKVLCRGEPVKDDIAEGAEIKIRIWTVHVTDEVPRIDSAPPPVQQAPAAARSPLPSLP
eukprot:CAMPEP_0179464740 /NCGR_PEP_ID=MMETSP0799-20121207/46481_1 /TAXON_ID=46947 /ORGANISM="Geminigera cryophila, Strain CCMP2564" /LENGTH=152 /DNA_ID=CAMNT_0021268675 /DNA_START=475 /DNA_END=930 /DNA_ORIENTATION=-